MDTKRYSIGEVSKVMGISVKLLRHYCDIGLITPAYVNPETGYRYFVYEQFPYIDRTRYLLQCGLGLKEIKEVLAQDDIGLLRKHLSNKRSHLSDEIRRMTAAVETIDWYLSYFSGDILPQSTPVVKPLPQRMLLTVPCMQTDTYEDYHIRLTALRHSEPCNRLRYRRQYAAILDYDGLVAGEFRRTHLGMYLDCEPDCIIEAIRELPAGDYLCFQARALSDGWDSGPVTAFFHGRPKPCLVLANEYETSVVEYSGSIFEIQIAIA